MGFPLEFECMRLRHLSGPHNNPHQPARMSSLGAAPHQSSELAVMHIHHCRSLRLAVRGSRCKVYCFSIALVPWPLPGSVIDFLLQRGYTLFGDRVLRSAPLLRASLAAVH